MQLFRHTPEPNIPNPKEYGSAMEAVRDGIREVRKTFGEIRKFKILAIYLASYLLFFDGINTIGGMASAFGDSVLRLNPTMNFVLLLMVNMLIIHNFHLLILQNLQYHKFYLLNYINFELKPL